MNGPWAKFSTRGYMGWTAYVLNFGRRGLRLCDLLISRGRLSDYRMWYVQCMCSCAFCSQFRSSNLMSMQLYVDWEDTIFPPSSWVSGKYEEFSSNSQESIAATFPQNSSVKWISTGWNFSLNHWIGWGACYRVQTIWFSCKKHQKTL